MRQEGFLLCVLLASSFRVQRWHREPPSHPPSRPCRPGCTMSQRKGNLASRSLEYHAPPVPSFLRALQAQVSASDRYSSSGSAVSKTHSDQLDSLVSATSSSDSNPRSTKRKIGSDDQQQQCEELDSDDEMNGAQVVVLKHGKHLSHDQALQLKKQAAQTSTQPLSLSTSTPPTGQEQNIAAMAVGGPSKKRRTPLDTRTVSTKPERRQASISSLLETSPSRPGHRAQNGDLDHVKQLIQNERNSKSTVPPRTPAPEKSAQQKRSLKNAQARKLKAQSGKGLSFDLSDE